MLSGLTLAICQIMLPRDDFKDVSDDGAVETKNSEPPPFSIGLSLLWDRQVMFAYLAGFIGQIAFQFNSSYITLQFKRKYHVETATAGLLASVQAISYFIGCFFVPMIPCMMRMPPKVQFIGSMALAGFASSFSGP